MTSTAFSLDNTDTEERDELRAYGITLSDAGEAQFPDAQSARDAAASQLLRQIGRLDADLDRYDKARGDEHRLIQQAWERNAAPVAARKAVLESILRQLATCSDFGDAKSRKLTNGVYGTRMSVERVSIEDQKECLAWSLANAPELISEKPAEQRVLQKAVETYFKAHGDLPDGVLHTPAHDEPFFKVEIPRVIA